MPEETQLSSDPSDYAQKKLSATVINFLLLQRIEMLKSFEKIHKKSTWTHRNLPDGSKQLRTGLVYSTKKEAIFCLHCLIFGSPHTTQNAKVFAEEGYKDWHNVSRDVELHETSKYHRESDISFIRWNAGKLRVDRRMAEVRNHRVNHHREVVSVVVDCIHYLIQEMMAFRKSDSNTGKLLNLFRLLSKYDNDAKVYLEMVEKHHSDGKRLRVNFLAYDSLMNLASIMRDIVLERICERINEARYFSLIADSTQDKSKAESTVVLIRYTEGLCEGSVLSVQPVVVERLIGVFTMKGSTGKELYEKIMAILKGNNLDVSKMIG